MAKKSELIFKQNSEQGFTLLELIIALAIATILLSLMAGVLIQASTFYHFFIEDSSLGGESLIIINKLSREISRAAEINIADNILTMKVNQYSSEDDKNLHWIRYRSYQSSRGLELGFQREASRLGDEIEFTRIDSVLGVIDDFRVDWISQDLIKVSISRATDSGKTISRQQTVFWGSRGKQ